MTSNMSRQACAAFMLMLGMLFCGAAVAQTGVIDTGYYYRLTTSWQGDGKSLDVVNDGTNNKVQLAASGSYYGQFWKFTSLGNGYYRMTNQWRGDGMSLDVVNDGTNNKVQLAATGAYTGQFWKLTPLGGGFYRLTTNWQGDGKSLDVVNDGTNNKVQLAATGNYSGQYWKLTKLGPVSADPDRGGAPKSATVSSKSNAAENIMTQLSSLTNNHVEYGIGGGITSTAATHIQGMAVVDKYWMLSHDNAGNRDGDLIFIDPEQRDRKNTHTYTFTGDDGFSAGAQGDGNYVAVATGENNSIRVFQIDSSAKATELTNLAKTDVFGSGMVENVSLAYHHGHKRHYLMATNNSTTVLFVSNGETLDSSSTWTDVSVSGKIPFGEAGTAMLYEASTQTFYVVSLGKSATSTKDENSFSVWTLKQSSGATPTSQFTAAAASTEYLTLTDGSGSFRWGGTAHVRGDGKIQIIAAPRDYKWGQDSDFGVWTSTSGNPVNPSLTIVIQSVKCVETTELGEDEIYLITNTGKRIPSGNETYHDIDNGQTWSVSQTISSSSDITVTLMEYDTVDDRDLIGSFTVRQAEAGSGQTKTVKLTGDGGTYQVTYKVQ